ncbi:MAG: helix-turn-helix domain-containing protein [Bacteroidales bacterium]|nr:helix-turn-helix domain-containing protein [Bacteroidales bacterium]
MCILLNCNQGKYLQKVTNEQISEVLKVGMRTIDRIKNKFIEEGLDESLERRSTCRIYERKTDGVLETKLTTYFCN